MSNPSAQTGRPGEAARGFVLPGLNHLRGWRLPSLSGQPVCSSACLTVCFKTKNSVESPVCQLGKRKGSGQKVTSLVALVRVNSSPAGLPALLFVKCKRFFQVSEFLGKNARTSLGVLVCVLLRVAARCVYPLDFGVLVKLVCNTHREGFLRPFTLS